MENNSKRKYLSILGLITISMFIIGASYAYFTVSTTNNFGTHTISGSMEDVGSVSLVSTGNNISLNLSAADMMQGDIDIEYYGTTDGTPTPNYNFVKLADVVVTGPGYYDCDYAMNISASGINNMYTAFQGMNGKSVNQIIISIDGTTYDFNTTNLFPTTKIGQIKGISSTKSSGITAYLKAVNKKNLDQIALAGTDITITTSITNFTCRALQTSYVYWNSAYDLEQRFESNEELIENNYLYYVRTTVAGTTDVLTELCGLFNGTEICFKSKDYDNVLVYKSQFEAAGATCQYNSMSIGKYLSCSNGSLTCVISDKKNDPDYCSNGTYECLLYNNGYAWCTGSDIKE